MTEELLRSAILRLQAQALEQYGVIKNIYHQPADGETVSKICHHAQLLAQLEGAMLTLQQYSSEIMVPLPVNVEVEEEEDTTEAEPPIGHEELMERSSIYRRTAETGETMPAQEAEEE